MGVGAGSQPPDACAVQAVLTSPCVSVWGKTDVPGCGPYSCLCERGPR